MPDLAQKVLSWQRAAGWCPLPSKKMGKLKELNYSKLFEIFWIRWLQERRLLDEDKMIIWKIRIAIDKMKIIIRLFDYSIDFWIIEYLMPKYADESHASIWHNSIHTAEPPILARNSSIVAPEAAILAPEHQHFGPIAPTSWPQEAQILIPEASILVT